MKQKKAILVVSLLLGGVLILIYFGISGVNFFFRTFVVSQPIVPPRNVITARGTELVWQNQVESRKVIIDNGIQNSKENFLYVGEDTIILPVWNLDNYFLANVSLTSFSLPEGVKIWENKLEGDGTSLAVGTNSDGIFTVSIDCKGANTMCGEIEIIKHNPESGNTEWKTNYSGIYPLGALSIDDNAINIIGGESEHSYYSENSFEAHTGEKLLTFQGIRHDPSAFPVKYGSIPLKLGYETYEIVGNIVTIKNYVAFLSKEESSLLIVDKKSGVIEGRVDFDGGPFSSRGNDFALGTTSNFIVVYLGDSEELFVFRLD